MPTFWSGGRMGISRRLAVGLVCFFVWGSLATGLNASMGPEPPPGTVFLVDYGFDSDQIVGDQLENVLDPTGWLNGQIVGSPATVAGYTGQALEFDGLEEYVELPESRGITFRQGVLVEAKVRVTSLAVDGGGIVAKWYAPDEWTLAVHPEESAYGRAFFAVHLDDDTEDGVRYTIEYLFPDASWIGNWFTLTGVYDPAVGLQLFVDDVLVDSDSVSGMEIVTGSIPIHVGDGGPEWSRFEGQIDDVRIWGDFSPMPWTLRHLIQYDFDEGQVREREIGNQAIKSAPWMTAKMEAIKWETDEEEWDSDDEWMPETVEGAGGGSDRALHLNIPRPVPEEWNEESWAWLEVERGRYLEFDQGLYFEAKIRLEQELDKSSYVIASQMDSYDEDEHLWQLSIDSWVLPGKYTLTFLLYLGDGSTQVLWYELPSDPAAYVDQWKHVAVTYDWESGVVGLFWEYRRVDVVKLDGTVPRTGVQQLRIGMGAESGFWAGFEGSIDEVKIGGDHPYCHPLTIDVDPPGAGFAIANPPVSRIPELCTEPFEYPTGEEIRLWAQAEEDAGFYKWDGPILFAEGSDRYENLTSAFLIGPASVTARFKQGDDWPTMTRFPINGPHNTGYDSTCWPNPCDHGCGRLALELSNNDCHGGGLDIFAELEPSKGFTVPVVAAQDGVVKFGCDYSKEDQELIGGNAAYVEIYPAEGSDPSFIFYYAHMDRVCFKNGTGQKVTNLCTDSRLHDDCPGCEEHVPETMDINCPRYYREGDTVKAGAMLGIVGKSGNAQGTTPHLHYGIYKFVSSTQWDVDCFELNPFPFLYALEMSTANDRACWRSGPRPKL
jgi:hypothetical protein